MYNLAVKSESKMLQLKSSKFFWNLELVHEFPKFLSDDVVIKFFKWW